ncbi:unnamed protein product, partial [Meganyctiphanes norvegica]
VAPTQTKVSPMQITAYPGDLREIECSVMAARPAVKITWTLNGRDITSDAQDNEIANTHDGTFMAVSTLHKVFNQEDNGQNLVCAISHPTFSEPDVTIVPISVYFSPVQKHVHTFYQVPLNSHYEIIISFSASPQPTGLVWSFGSNFQEMTNHIQVPIDNGKFSTSLIIHDNGNYQ